MAVYEVFSHPELRRYRTHICSKATLLMLIILIVTFIPPLLIVYRSFGFWIKTDTYSEFPDVHFKRELLLVLDLEGEGNFLTYSTFQRYNVMQQDRIRVPLITSRELDTNGDGKPNYLDFSMEVPLADTEKVVGLKLIMIFDYKLYQFTTLTMEGMAYLERSSPIAGASYKVAGDLRVSQKQPLGYRGPDNRYNTPVINGSSIYAEDYDLFTILKKYQARNVSTILNAPYNVWSTGRASGQPFVISGQITYPEERFTYTPGFWFLIKWGWVQYASVLLLFLFLFDRVKVFIYQNQLVATMVDKPFEAKKVH